MELKDYTDKELKQELLDRKSANIVHVAWKKDHPISNDFISLKSKLYEYIMEKLEPNIKSNSTANYVQIFFSDWDSE